MSVKKLLLWALTHTSAYESDKEKRHPKMPEDYVLLVIPR